MSIAQFIRESVLAPRLKQSGCMVVYDAEASRRLRAVQERYLARSTRLDPRAWYTRPAWRRLIENAVGLLSPLL